MYTACSTAACSGQQERKHQNSAVNRPVSGHQISHKVPQRILKNTDSVITDYVLVLMNRHNIVRTNAGFLQWSLLLTWTTFNPRMDK